MPVLQVDQQARVLQHPGITPLEPVIEPAYRLITPLIPRSVIAAVRKVMIPGTDPRLDRRLHLLQHPRNAVAVAVLKTADEKGRYVKLLDRAHNRRSPEGIIV